jgi:hypothetical protein
MATTVTASFSTNATNTATFNSAVSSFTAYIPASGAIDSNFTSGVLSGSSTVYSGSLSFVLTAIAGNTIAGGDTSVLLTLSGAPGNNLFYGFVKSSSYVPTTRVATFAIGFYGSDYISTTINLSANGISNIVVADPTLSSPFDIAFQYVPGSDNDVLAGNSSYIHTVSDFLRRLNLNG